MIDTHNRDTKRINDLYETQKQLILSISSLNYKIDILIQHMMYIYTQNASTPVVAPAYPLQTDQSSPNQFSTNLLSPFQQQEGA